MSGADPLERFERLLVRPLTPSPLLGLAPGGGYLAILIAENAGGLLHHLFTLARLKDM